MRRNPKHLPPNLAGVICATGAFLFLAGCTSEAQQKAQGPPPPPLVDVMPVAVSDVPILSDYPAQTYARNTVDVRPRVAGYVEKWLFTPGSAVSAGQPLYVLDLRPLQAAVTQAEGNLHQSEADLEFGTNQPDKWKIATTTTGTSINAGNYKVIVSATDVQGLSISGLEVQ